MSDDFVPTRGSSKKALDQINFQTVTFESYKAKSLKKGTTVTNVKKPSQPEFNIKKTKHEVVKFGMAGFDPQKKEEAKIQLAIKLGAKPPKNKYKNYKILKVEKATRKKEESLQKQFQQLGKNSMGKSTAKNKRFNKPRKKGGGLLDVYGNVKKTKPE